MTTKIRLFLAMMVLLFATNSSLGQNYRDSNDPREMALDVYSGIIRGMETATIALRLKQIVELFRYRCTRVTDYQVFLQRPNITDIKVKCSGDPLYGVTVASNGFISVYGGNSMLSPLDSRDALILSFDAEGSLSGTSALNMQRLKDAAGDRFILGEEYYNYYLAGMLLLLLGIVVVMVLVFIRVSRRKTGRKPRSRMKPMQKYSIGPSSDLKSRLVADGTKIGKFVYQHESGLVIAIGRRGKRRLFLSVFWAKLYARWNLHYFEVTDEQLSHIDLNLPDAAEIVEEGEEIQLPH